DESGIRLGIAPTGEAIDVRGPAGAVNWLFPIAFFAIWYGVLGIFARLGAPIFVIAIFVAISLVVLVLLGDLLVGRSHVVVESHRLVARRTWFGLGSSRIVEAADIESITPQVGLTSGSRVYHDVVIKLRSGKSLRAAKHIPLRRDA